MTLFFSVDFFLLKMEIKTESLDVLNDLIQVFSNKIKTFQPKLSFKLKINVKSTMKLNILCFGASMTKGYIDSSNMNYEPYGIKLAELIENELELNLDEYKIHIHGRNGEMACNMEYRLKPLMHDNNYDLAIILAGTNDIGRGKGLDQTIQAISHLHNIILDNKYNKYPTSTLMITVPDTKIKKLGSRNIVKERNYVNNGLINYVNKKSKELNNKCIMLLDLYHVCLSKNILILFILYPNIIKISLIIKEMPWKDDPFWSRDGLHFSVQGYRKIGKLIFNTIKQWCIDRV